MESSNQITKISNVDILNMLNSDKSKKNTNEKIGGGKYYGKKNFDLNINSKCSSKNCVLSIDNELLN
jgi:hypothetical protein